MQYGCNIASAHAVYGNTPLFFLCGETSENMAAARVSERLMHNLA
jgi:hypothetical protein